MANEQEILFEGTCYTIEDIGIVVAELGGDIETIQMQLSVNDMADKLSAEEYKKWRHSAKYALVNKKRQILRLKAMIKKARHERGVATAKAMVNSENPHAYTLILHGMVVALAREGRVQLTDREWKIMDNVQIFLRDNDYES